MQIYVLNSRYKTGGISAMPVALVTGAGSGIGRAIAERLSRGGAVGVFDRNDAAVAEAVSSIGASGNEAIGCVGDVTRAADLAKASRDLVQRFGRLDTVVANAGVDTYGSFLDTAEEDWDRVFSINAKGVFLTAKETIPHLLRSGSGSFVAISSDAGLVGCPGFATYSASKHAVVGLVRSIAVEFGRTGLRANVVCPAFVETPMSAAFSQNASQSEVDFWRRVVPLKRFAQPHEVASVVAYLTSSEASYVNGAVYAVDGGATAELHRGAA